MRRASQERSIVFTTFTPPKDASRSSVATDPKVPASRRSIQSAPTEILLLPNGTFVNDPDRAPIHQDAETLRRRQLAIAIRQRIETRLGSRIKNLAVRIVGETIFLEGQCYTYYTKQLAQHAALGILDHEHLENLIAVVAPR